MRSPSAANPIRVYVHAGAVHGAALAAAARGRADVELVAELAGADCVAYAPDAAVDDAIVADLGRFLEGGKCVISAIAYPEPALARLREACRRGGAALHVTGPYLSFVRERMTRRLARAFSALETVRAADRPAGFALDMAGGSSRFVIEAAFTPTGDGDALIGATAKALLDAAAPVCSMAPGIVVEDEYPRYQMDDRL